MFVKRAAALFVAMSVWSGAMQVTAFAADEPSATEESANPPVIVNVMNSTAQSSTIQNSAPAEQSDAQPLEYLAKTTSAGNNTLAVALLDEDENTPHRGRD